MDSARHDEQAARNRAGAAIRNLGHAFVGRQMTVSQIEHLSSTLEGLADELWPGEQRLRELTDLDFIDSELPQGRLQPDFSDRPISGGASPWGLDLDVSRVGDEIVAVTTLRAAHEGAPERAHGGITAALFDDVMGFVLGAIKQPAFTGELTVRYIGPTPLYRPIECRARAVGRERRKLFMTAELTDLEHDRLVARSQATFITIDGYEQTAQRPAPPTAPNR